MFPLKEHDTTDPTQAYDDSAGSIPNPSNFPSAIGTTMTTHTMEDESNFPSHAKANISREAARNALEGGVECQSFISNYGALNQSIHPYLTPKVIILPMI